MKIHSLEISNIRGIRDFQHDFEGKNAIILGANGTGKSSILDAIDFLLTGKISRLRGEGTGGITLPKHGIHVDMSKQLESGYVKASVQLLQHPRPITIQRCLGNPEELICPDGDLRLFNKTMRLAGQGQHMLTRRQMLKFITVKPKDRALQIQALMNLEQVEVARANLVSVHNLLRNKKLSSESATESSRSDVSTVLGLERYETSEVLRTVNVCRKKLGARLLKAVSAKTIRLEVDYRAQSEEGDVNPALLLEYTNNINNRIGEANVQHVVELDLNLRKKLNQLRRDTVLRRSLSQRQLLELGLTLLEDDFCPLCDRPWNQDELKTHLENKIEQASLAGQLLSDIRELEGSLRLQIKYVLSNLEHILNAPDFFSNDLVDEFRLWKSRLSAFEQVLQNSISMYLTDTMPTDHVNQLFDAESISNAVERALERLQLLLETSSFEDRPETVAFVRLAQAEIALAQLEEHITKQELSRIAYVRCKSLFRYFGESSNEILGNLYNGLSDEFGSLYRTLHEDESDFSAKICPQNAGLNLEVGFYDRGLHPPNALHSEGHQDSMGLCMFLVLSERLSGNDLQVLLLDDVIMSADLGHRKNLARLLADEFENRQVILTTHDIIWVEQLKRENFASGENIIELHGWTIDTGPIYREVREVWDSIESDLNSNQANTAGSKLRNWAESFSKHVCHNFKAPVPYRIDGKYTLADLLQPAQNSFRKYLKKAIKNAQNNNNSDILDKVMTVDGKMHEVSETISKETWVLNWTSHDNQGNTLTSDEVRDAVSAFKEFAALARCQNCCGFLELTNRREVIICKCGNVSWRV